MPDVAISRNKVRSCIAKKDSTRRFPQSLSLPRNDMLIFGSPKKTASCAQKVQEAGKYTRGSTLIYRFFMQFLLPDAPSQFSPAGASTRWRPLSESSESATLSDPRRNYRHFTIILCALSRLRLLYLTVLDGVIQQNIDQLVPGTVGLTCQCIQVSNRFILDADGKGFISILTF